MSFALKPKPFCRLPLVRYSARTKRENRIRVQLLRDFPQYGVKGEIIDVLPGLMRNRLYPGNGAAYIIPELNIGPRIPVVKREVKAAVADEVKPQVVKPIQLKNVKKIKPIEIKSLSFDIPETTESLVQVGPGYSLFSIEVNMGRLKLKMGSKKEITKANIIESIFLASDVLVPADDLVILGKGEPVESIKEVGEYQVKITKDGVDVVKPLIISA